MAATGTSTSFNRADSVALKEHLECVMTAQRQQMEVRLDAIDRATELRESKTDVKINQLCKDIADLKSYRDTMQGKASQQSVTISLLIAVAGLILTIARWLVGG